MAIKNESTRREVEHSRNSGKYVREVPGITGKGRGLRGLELQ